jgi:hypothetical protein
MVGFAQDSETRTPDADKGCNTGSVAGVFFSLLRLTRTKANSANVVEIVAVKAH